VLRPGNVAANTAADQITVLDAAPRPDDHRHGTDILIRAADPRHRPRSTPRRQQPAIRPPGYIQNKCIVDETLLSRPVTEVTAE
jgi:hypothetical protein